MSNNEYRSATLSQRYSTLSCYNPMQSASGQYQGTAKQIIPTYGAPGYNTLQHGTSAPVGGHFNYSQAYGGVSGCNQQYTVRVCGGCQKQ